MGNAKFGMNALLLIVIIFSAIAFLITVKLAGLSGGYPVNEYYPIEGTELSVRYNSVYPNGLCRGSRNAAVLLLEGDFGHDWGAAAEGKNLYLNEYTSTTLGLVRSQVDLVDTETVTKRVLLRDTVLLGRCASGELVCLGSCVLPANSPKTSGFARLYALSARDLRPESDGALVIFLDPASGEVLWSRWDEKALEEGFEERWLGKTLAEVRG